MNSSIELLQPSQQPDPKAEMSEFMKAIMLIQQQQMQEAKEERRLVREQMNKEKEMKEADQETKQKGKTLNNTRMIDTNNSLKIKTWAGEQSSFESFKRSVYMCIGALSSVHLEKLQIVEANRDTEYTFETITDEDKIQAREIFPHLASHVEGKAEIAVESAEEGNGFEAWRSLCRVGLIQNSDAALHILQHPHFDHGTDPRVKLQIWNRSCKQFEKQFLEKVTNSIKLSVYKRLICPSTLMAQGNVSEEMRKKMQSPELLAAAIVAYCENEESDQQMNAAYGNVQVNSIDIKSKSQKKKNQKAGKGKNDSKHNGKVKGKFGKQDVKNIISSLRAEHGGAKGDGKKGKAHKSFGKHAAKGDQKKFGGYCNYCWRLWHKEAQCWFKQKYQQYQNTEAKGKQGKKGKGKD